MATLSGEWVVGLGLFALLLVLAWQALFPGLTDSSPEVDTQPGQARQDVTGGPALPPHLDLPG